MPNNGGDKRGHLESTTLRPEDDKRAQVRRYRLLVIGENEHTSHPLPTSGDVTVGRSAAADIQVADPLMSRVHAVIHVARTLAVSDLGSSNGTLVRSSRLPPDEKVPISVGDIIELGSTVMIVQPEFARGALPAVEVQDTDHGTASPAAPPDDPMQRLYKLARRIASSTINVLLLGETGVGKEVMARTLHRLSPRASKPFMGLNCAAFNETLFESELFGYEKGAFTGAVAPKQGLIEAADGGTLFLDECGEMVPSTQAKLLRAIEERRVMRVGGLKTQAVDVRFVAATNQNLEAEVAAGRFREDLYYRLNGITLVIPPLRDRTTEIPSLAKTFIGEACQDAGYSSRPVLSREALEWMESYNWPGNIRELRNAVNRAVLLASGGTILPEHLHQGERYQPSKPGGGASASAAAAAPSSDGDSEKQRILDALAECGGNQTRAAKLLGISRRTLTARLDKLGIPRPRKGK